MNAHTFLPTSPVKGEAISLPWTAVVEPCMGLWEPVMLAGHAAAWNSPGIARAFAKGHPGATDIFIGFAAERPSVERIREITNPPRIPVPSVSFDVEAMDSHKFQQEAAKGRGVFEGRR